ncbi:MAG: magnesium/cobalt transporter CorA [Calditrichia bacterium]
MVDKFLKKRSKKIGLPPGTMIHVGEKMVEKVSISLIDYDESQWQARELKNVEEALPFKDTPTTSWLNITGLHDPGVLENIGTYFDIHPLVLEDVLNTDQRPKLDFFDDYLFVVLKMIRYDEENEEVDIEQVSIILGQNYVITFQEREGDIFQSVRERIKDPRSRLRRKGPGYLMYALIDVIVDHYFLVLEKLGETLEELEENVLESPRRSVVQTIHRIKRELLVLRKSIWPLRELISGLLREESDLIDASLDPFFRDVYDHTIQVVDTLETYRDMISGILDLYLSTVSNRMNEIMKVLTIIATIFIPLTFIAGVYGMNFEYMPELKWRWGYFAVLGLMGLIFIGMLIYFRRKKWL